MTGDPRVQALLDHAEAMLDILDKYEAETSAHLKKEKGKEESDEHTIAFLNSMLQRIDALEEMLEEDVIQYLISLNNLSAPMRHLLDK